MANKRANQQSKEISGLKGERIERKSGENLPKVTRNHPRPIGIHWPRV